MLSIYSACGGLRDLPPRFRAPHVLGRVTELMARQGITESDTLMVSFMTGCAPDAWLEFALERTGHEWGNQVLWLDEPWQAYLVVGVHHAVYGDTPGYMARRVTAAGWDISGIIAWIFGELEVVRRLACEQVVAD